MPLPIAITTMELITLLSVIALFIPLFMSLIPHIMPIVNKVFGI